MEQDIPAQWPDHGTTTLSLNVANINCCSVRSLSKRSQLAALLIEHNVDIVIRCESHLYSSISSSEILPQNYKIHRKDQSLGEGGVFIGVYNHLNGTTKSGWTVTPNLYGSKFCSLHASHPLYTYVPFTDHPTMIQVHSIISTMSLQLYLKKNPVDVAPSTVTHCSLLVSHNDGRLATA